MHPVVDNWDPEDPDPVNISVKEVQAQTFHTLMSEVKEEAPLNMDLIVVTLEVSHLDTSELKEEAR